jgi:hypothetical protein
MQIDPERVSDSPPTKNGTNHGHGYCTSDPFHPQQKEPPKTHSESIQHPDKSPGSNSPKGLFNDGPTQCAGGSGRFKPSLGHLLLVMWVILVIKSYFCPLPYLICVSNIMSFLIVRSVILLCCVMLYCEILYPLMTHRSKRGKLFLTTRRLKRGVLSCCVVVLYCVPLQGVLSCYCQCHSTIPSDGSNKVDNSTTLWCGGKAQDSYIYSWSINNYKLPDTILVHELPFIF